MEEYEFGKHLAFETVLENKEYYANLFAEGNPELKKILDYCFNNNIETYMCCAGHPDDEYSMPFIVFNIPYSKKEIAHSIVSSVYDINGLSIMLIKDHERDAIQVDIRAYSNDFFKNLYDGVTDLSNASKATSEVVNIVEVVNKFNHPSYDLYFQTVKYPYYSRQYDMRVDYHMKDNQSTRLCVLEETLNCEQASKIEEAFNNQKLDQEAIKEEESALQKIKR